MRLHQLLLVLACVTLALASCGARSAGPAGDTSGHSGSPETNETESVGANQSEQPVKTEASAPASAWVLVDGMTKLQDIT